MANLEDLPLRDSLKGKTPYGAPQLRVEVALNVNENTHVIPEPAALEIVTRLASEILTLNRYPDREFTQLREALAAYVGHGMLKQNLWAANGSNEVIQQIFQAFGGPGRKALSFAPTYSMYSIIAEATDTAYVGIQRQERYELSADYVASVIKKHQPDIVLLCSPNNPTGTPLPLEVIEAAYDASRSMVLVDEAYAEFAKDGSKSAISLLEGRERLMVSRTMSKAFAFAGARLGYLVSDPAVADALRLVRLPYHLSALTQAAALGALAHAELMLSAVASIRVQRDRIIRELSQLGLDVFDSDANFVLFGGLENPKDVWQKLLDRGVLVRDVGLPGSLRVTAGTETETTKFLSALGEILEG
jgi:histidinol-phosphate aminotransferase